MSETPPLDDSVLKFLGKPVFASPDPGVVWQEADGSGLYPFGEPPAPFRFTITEFLPDWNDATRGGKGFVTEPGHVYDGCWLLFYVWREGPYDFEHRIGRYRFHVAPRQPSPSYPPDIPPMESFDPPPGFPDSNCVQGTARITANLEIPANNSPG